MNRGTEIAAGRGSEEAEALGLLRLLARLTAEGVAALEAGDEEALPSILDRRQAVIDRATPVLSRLTGAEGGTAAAPSPEARARLEVVERNARALAAEETRLLERMATRRDHLAAELEEAESGAAAHAAYASGPRARALDLVR